MRENDSNDEFPIVAPLADYNFISEPGTMLPGDQYRFDANLMALSRIEGRDSRRISVISGYQLPFFGAIGDVYELKSEEHTSELQSLMRSTYAVFCLKKKNKKT